MPSYAKNKKALFDYELLETLEAGLVLSGHEVKSVRSKHIRLAGSFISIHDNAAFLTNAHIAMYRYANVKNYDPTQPRKLLLTKKQICYLTGKTHEKGLTIVPLSVYTKGRLLKMEIGIVRGKKKYDKRRIIKEREQKREIGRAMKEIN
ncbi:MAG TPA: SsrA-binding protein [Candidatus Magasanikbacteria bacterium]|nr:MAG: SsrA-binding protein [Candidatus Magasanikbacteria bacterium RIFOXYC2_FULL_39_8]HAT03364.1 SsrA-binding protein [Candidatus Magasanikbacteria bacterium]